MCWNVNRKGGRQMLAEFSGWYKTVKWVLWGKHPKWQYIEQVTQLSAVVLHVLQLFHHWLCVETNFHRWNKNVIKIVDDRRKVHCPTSNNTILQLEVPNAWSSRGEKGVTKVLGCSLLFKPSILYKAKEAFFNVKSRSSRLSASLHFLDISGSALLLSGALCSDNQSTLSQRHCAMTIKVHFCLVKNVAFDYHCTEDKVTGCLDMVYYLLNKLKGIGSRYTTLMYSMWFKLACPESTLVDPIP